MSSAPTRILEGIRDGNYHKGGIRCLQLMQLEDRYFDELGTDIERLLSAEHGSDVTDPRHITNWTRPRGDVTQYSLVNTTGRFDDFSTDHNLSTVGKRFRWTAQYPTLGHFVSVLPDTVNVRLNILGPRARLSAHEEQSIIRTAGGRVSARVRFHLPVITNPRAELILDGAVYHLEARVVYFINHGCVHAAWNRGDIPRVHVVWDSLLTQTTFDRMFRESSMLPVKYFSRDTSSPAPVRTQRPEAHVALPPTVSWEEASRVELHESQ